VPDCSAVAERSEVAISAVSGRAQAPSADDALVGSLIRTMSFYQWRFKISLAALRNLPRSDGIATDRRGAEQRAKASSRRRPLFSGFLSLIRFSWRRRRGLSGMARRV
jgi:hypothetical protein